MSCKPSLFSIRLRERVKLYDRRILETTGVAVEVPGIPARTTLEVLDVFGSGFYVIAPDGRKLIIGTETLKRAGYTPR